MTDILIVYSTVEGQTRKIAEHAGDHIVRRGRNVRVVDAAATPLDLDPHDYDAVIVAASIHMRRHNPPVVHFIRQNLEALSDRPGALISVSLHAVGLERKDVEEAREYVDVLAAETGWLPIAVHYAAGALRFARYDFFKRWAMRRIAAERGLDTAPEEGEAEGADVEYTDWRALDDFLDDFLDRHAPLKRQGE